MPLSRRKSCKCCRESKARCNQGFPQCSRCLDRGLRCVYEDGNVRFMPYPTSFPARQPMLDAELGLETLPTCELTQGFGHEFPLPVLDDAFELDWPTFSKPGITGLSTPKSPHLPSLPATGRPQKQSFSAQPAGVGRRQSSGGSQSPFLLLDQENSPPTGPTTISPATDTSTERTVLRSLPRKTLRRRQILSKCILTNVLLGQITSYPKMMIEGDTLPPFIHPPCHLDEKLATECGEKGSHQCLPGNLAICASLVNMFYARTAANASFVWKTIYDERGRLQREYLKFGPEDQLTALQSLTLFLLLQAADADSAEKNGAHVLLATVLDIGRSIASSQEWRLGHSKDRLERQAWVFRESLRRVNALLGIIELLLDGVTGDYLYSTFQSTPLTAPRELWEARTNREWWAQYGRYIDGRVSSKVLTVGDLVESEETGCFTDLPRRRREAEVLPDVVRWCETLDGLGTLIWMAIPCLQYRRTVQNW